MTITASVIERDEKLDDVWPKVRKLSNGLKEVHWKRGLWTQHIGDDTYVKSHDYPVGSCDDPNTQTPIHGIELVVTAEGGEELPRVEVAGRNSYLVLAAKTAVRIKGDKDDYSVGRVFANYIHHKPLPRGTVTTIPIFNGSIGEVVSEPPKPKFPHVLKSGVVLLNAGEAYRFTFPHNEATFNDGYKTVWPKLDDLREALAYIESVDANGGGV